MAIRQRSIVRLLCRSDGEDWEGQTLLKVNLRFGVSGQQQFAGGKHATLHVV